MFTSLFLLSTLIICFYDVPVKEKKVIELDYDEPGASEGLDEDCGSASEVEQERAVDEDLVEVTKIVGDSSVRSEENFSETIASPPSRRDSDMLDTLTRSQGDNADVERPSLHEEVVMGKASLSHDYALVETASLSHEPALILPSLSQEDAMKHSPSQKVEEAAAPSESDPTFSPHVILDEKEVPINTQESVNMEKRVPPLSQEDVFIKPYSHECDASKPSAPQIVKEDDDATASISEAPTSSPREDDSIAISEQSGSPVYSPRNVMFESEDEESVSTLTSTSRRKRFSSGLKRRVPSSDSMGSLRRKLSMKKLSSVKKLLKK